MVTDDFWARVELLVSVRERPAGKGYTRKVVGGRKSKPARLVFEAIWAAGLAEYDQMEGIA